MPFSFEIINNFYVRNTELFYYSMFTTLMKMEVNFVANTILLAAAKYDNRFS